MMRKRLAIVLALLCSMLHVCPALADAVPGSSGTAPQVFMGTDSCYYIYQNYLVQMVPVYCFYSSYMKDYFWTASEQERKTLEQDFLAGRSTYVYQGISGYVEKDTPASALPVYRFWNKNTTDHFYTTSETEKQQLEADYRTGKDHYEYEGIAWYTPSYSAYPAYRFFDVNAFNHYYTSDENTSAALQAEYLSGTGSYRYEGIAWYWYQ